jgi:RNA polymerase sigma-70 factor (ECF subfamily)
MSQDDFAAAVRAWQGGDRHAFDALYDRVAPRLSAICRLLTRSEAEAEDLFQETWRKAVTRVHTLRDPAAFPDWIAAVARNLWRNEHARRRVALGDLARRKAVAREGGPDEGLSGLLVRDVLAGLSPGLREAFVLYHLEGRSLRETARDLGATVREVRDRLAAAQEALVRRVKID